MYSTRIQLYIHCIASVFFCARQFPSIPFRGDSCHISLYDGNFEPISLLQNITRSCPLGCYGYLTADMLPGILPRSLYKHLFWCFNALNDQITKAHLHLPTNRSHSFTKLCGIYFNNTEVKADSKIYWNVICKRIKIEFEKTFHFASAEISPTLLVPL